MIIGAAEVGGSHVSAARVALDSVRLDGMSVARSVIRGDGSADELVAAIAALMVGVAAPARTRWGIAMPGPFDYAAGVGRFAGVGKFASLHGVDVRSRLADAAAVDPARLVFLNDADAFLLGEAHAGHAVGRRRCVALTLGTGVGSAFLTDGRLVTSGPGVFPDGRAHLLTLGGGPLEDVVSHRAVVAAYADATGRSVAGVREVAERARAGEPHAVDVLTRTFLALGTVVGPYLARFDPSLLLVGGSMTGAWDLIEAPLRVGLAQPHVDVVAVPDGERSALVGAAAWAAASSGG